MSGQPIMTRRHYRLLARALHGALPAAGDDTVLIVVRALVAELQADNPRFDRARFTEWVRTGDDGTARRYPD